MAHPARSAGKEGARRQGREDGSGTLLRPNADIFETDEALKVVMEVPGVDRKDIDIRLEEDVLRVEARIDSSTYEGMEPLYTEYNVGHFARAFTLSHHIDQQQIAQR